MERSESRRTEEIVYQNAIGDLVEVKSVIKSIGEAQAVNGSSYWVIEFGNGDKLRFFDKKMVEGLKPGMNVEYGKKKNQKGYWNPVGISAIPTKEAPRSAPVQSEAVPADRLLTPPPEALDARGRERWEMRAMNSLTNSVNLFNTLVQKDWLRLNPVLSEAERVQEATETIFMIQRAFMGSTEAPKPQETSR